MPDIILTADKTVLINHRLTCVGDFVACIPRASLPGIFKNYLEKKTFPGFHLQRGKMEVLMPLLIFNLGYRKTCKRVQKKPGIQTDPLAGVYKK